MNQDELIRMLAKENGTSSVAAEANLKALGKIVRTVLAGGDDVTLPGIGKLAVKQTAARTGRNPRTGESVQIPAKTKPVFTAAKALKDTVA